MLNITLAIPTLDSIPGEAFYTHMALAMKLGRTARVAIPPAFNIKPHDRARAELFEHAIRNGSDYIFFIDDDMIIPDDAYCRLLEVFSYRKPRPVAVSGHYYRRGWDYTNVWSIKTDKLETGFGRVDAPSGVHQIDYSGLGCCLIDVKWVHEKLTRPYFTMEKGEFSTEVTDDISFFERVRLAGGAVYGNADVRCGHLGERKVICDRTVDDLRKLDILIAADMGRSLDEKKEVKHG